jgi:hypothetical protein
MVGKKEDYLKLSLDTVGYSKTCEEVNRKYVEMPGHYRLSFVCHVINFNEEWGFLILYKF